MTRCIDFYEKVERDGNFCGMRHESYVEVMRYIAFKSKYTVICELTECAIRPLLREKDPEIQAKAIRQIEKRLKHGDKPTGMQVKNIIESIHEGVSTKGRVQRNVNILVYPMRAGDHKHHFTPRLIVGIPKDVHQDCASGKETEVHRKKVLLWVFENDKRKYHVMNEYLSGRMPIPSSSPFKIKRGKK